MNEQPADSPTPLDYRASPARRAWAREMAEAYQIVLRVENGRYVGRGLELPEAIGRGATARACVRATRAAMVSAVEGLVEAGQTPPVPEFPASSQTMGSGRRRAVRWARNVMFATT